VTGRHQRRFVQGAGFHEKMMVPTDVRVFTCLNHDGFHGASSHRASIIVARDEVHARELLDKALERSGLKGFRKVKYTLWETPLDRWSAEVLADGSM